MTNGLVDQPTGASRADFPLVMTEQDPEFDHPTAYNWSLSVQRELPWQMVADVTYVGRMGLHLQRERNINQLQPGTVQANPGVNVNALRPYLGFATIRLSENTGRSIYHGLQLNLERRFRNGLGFGVAYTYSGCATTAPTSATSSTTPTTTAAIWSRFRQRPHPPVQRALPLRAAVLAQAGHAASRSCSAAGRSRASPTSSRGCRSPSRARTTSPASATRPPSRRTSSAIRPSTTRSSRTAGRSTRTSGSTPAAFARPAAGTFGNAGRNPDGLRAPGFNSWDIALFKNIPLGGSKRLQLRLEAFNFINHPLVGNPNQTPSTSGGASSSVGGVNVDPSSADFGRVLTKTGERNIQLGAKFSF